jgi:hypothetical protein
MLDWTEHPHGCYVPLRLGVGGPVALRPGSEKEAIMATGTTHTIAQLRDQAHELLEMGTQYAALEDEIQSKADDLLRSPWDDAPYYINEIYAGLGGVREAARPDSGYDAHELRDLIQQTADVVDLAFKRAERA